MPRASPAFDGTYRRTPVQDLSSKLSCTPVARDVCSTPVFHSSCQPRNIPQPRNVVYTQQTIPEHCDTPAPWFQGRRDFQGHNELHCVSPNSQVFNADPRRQYLGNSATDYNATSYFDLLPDQIVVSVFMSGLNSLELCRCAAVCKRWNQLVWNPILWTSIDLSNTRQINVDEALRSLTGILSRDTPTVCITVVKVVLSGCCRLTDQGLHTVAKRCTELCRLEISGCRLITNVALFQVISRCVNLVHLDVTGLCARIIWMTSQVFVFSTNNCLFNHRVD